MPHQEPILVFHSLLVHSPAKGAVFIMLIIRLTHLSFPALKVTASDPHIQLLFVANSDIEETRFLSFQAILRQIFVLEPDPKASEIKRNTLNNP